jgi:hypothetical protein
MDLPPITNTIWRDLLQKRKSLDFEFLGLKMLLGRLIMDVERDPSPDSIDKCCQQLHDLLAKNEHLPTVRRDIQKIIG